MKIKDPLKLLQEIDAWIMFRYMAGEPTFPVKDMTEMRKDIQWTLQQNGIGLDGNLIPIPKKER